MLKLRRVIKKEMNDTTKDNTTVASGGNLPNDDETEFTRISNEQIYDIAGGGRPGRPKPPT